MKVVDKMRKQDVNEILKLVECYSVRSGGIQDDNDIDKIKKFVRETLFR